MSSSSFILSQPFHLLRRRSPPPSARKSRTTSFSIRSASALSDPFVLQLAETLEDSLPSSSLLQKLRDSSSESILSKTWPTFKDEPFRFTDTSFLKKSKITPVPQKLNYTDNTLISGEDDEVISLVIVDGQVVPNLSDRSLPPGVFVGSISAAPEIVLNYVAAAEFSDGDLFWDLNGVGAPDIAVIYVPAGVRVGKPVFLRFISSEGSKEGSNWIPLSNPRCMVLVEERGEVEIIEEYVSLGDEDKCYWMNSAMEIAIEAGAKVGHSYIQRQAPSAAHIKWTFVRQGASSSYELIETSMGGKLSRHNLHIQQMGPDTVTELSAFHVCGSNQTQDLHSRLVLDHPRGYSRQLHKCVVVHSSGQAIFDGNIKVNRYAQQTDAGQLSRSLLLAPRATVNLKPNLQIIADDVKCSHGAAISDLEEDQLFFFQERGIDLQTARNALLFSFGAEVFKRLPDLPLRKRVENQVRELLIDRAVIQ